MASMRPPPTVPQVQFDPEAALREHVHRANTVVVWVAMVWYGAVTISHLLLLPMGFARLMVPVALATSIGALVGGIWQRRHPEPARRVAHGFALAITVAVWINSYIHLLVSRELKQTTNIGVVLFAASAMLLSPATFFFVLGLSWVTWIGAMVFRLPHEDAMHWAFMLVSASVVATVINSTRRNSVLRLERLRAEDKSRRAALEAVTGSLNELLDHIGDAIVAFDREGRVVGAFSQRAQQILGASEGASLVALLYPDRARTPVEVAAFEQFVELAFSVPESAWDELAEVMPRTVRTLGPDGVERELALDFRPIVEGGRTVRVLLLAHDETEQTRLARELREQEKTHARRIEQMRRLLGVGPLLATFLRSAERRMQRIADHDRDEVLQQAHALKGEADALGLEDVRVAAARLEAAAAARAPELDLSSLRSALDDARDAYSRASGTSLDDAVPTLGSIAAPLVDRVPEWAESIGKKARLLVDDPSFELPTDLAAVLPGALTHLVRNAVAHGIEHERGDKPPVGVIRLGASRADGRPVIEVSDDGAGFDLEKLGARTVEEARERAFTVGVSTAALGDGLSGRGVGLPGVRADLEEIGYRVDVESSSSGTRFRIAHG